MEESERVKCKTEASVERFAEKVASSLIKETVAESTVANIWSIPCSSDCHSHTFHKGSQGSVAGSSLCWTPEGNLDRDDVTTCSEPTATRDVPTVAPRDPVDATMISPALPRLPPPYGPRFLDPAQPTGDISDTTDNLNMAEVEVPETVNNVKLDNSELIPSRNSARVSSSPVIDHSKSGDSEGTQGAEVSEQNAASPEGEARDVCGSSGSKSSDISPLCQTLMSPSSGQPSSEQLENLRTPARNGVESPVHPSHAVDGEQVVDSEPFVDSQDLDPSPRERPDAVHYRLNRQTRQIVTSAPSGVGVLTEEITTSVIEDTEYRNKSVENLRSDTANLHPNGLKQSLRKGLSVNDIAECSTSSAAVGSASAKQSTSSRSTFLRTFGLKKQCDEVTQRESDETRTEHGGGRKKIKSLRKTLTNMFHFKPRDGAADSPTERKSLFKIPTKRNKSLPPGKRALPPVPAVPVDLESRTPSPQSDLADQDAEWASRQAEAAPEPAPHLNNDDDPQKDFAESIEKVKDHGWYWGPLSGEAAERILSGEPDGSFVVRDSSDDHYIFSLTFKLNGFVRHVRIEHDQGNFSFGSFTKFKSTTIVDFIENAVEHSRSGRYLFFLHRRPVLGPMRVQLLHPVSRFKRVQSLKHLCRYVIVKNVRKDHLNDLPVPNSIKTYLNTRFYYSEQLEEEAENDTALHSQDLDNSLEEEEEDAVDPHHLQPPHEEHPDLSQAVMSFPGTPEQGSQRSILNIEVSPSSALHTPQTSPAVGHLDLQPREAPPQPSQHSLTPPQCSATQSSPAETSYTSERLSETGISGGPQSSDEATTVCSSDPQLVNTHSVEVTIHQFSDHPTAALPGSGNPADSLPSHSDHLSASSSVRLPSRGESTSPLPSTSHQPSLPEESTKTPPYQPSSSG